MKRSRRTVFLLFVATTVLIALVLTTLVLTVPSFKQEVKGWLHDFRRPAVPDDHTLLTISNDGSSSIQDPPMFKSAAVFSPNLHFDLGRYALTESSSPAIVRRVGDVSDSLISVSAGFLLRCDGPAPDLHIIIRIDRANGEPVEWDEKRLRPREHTPGKDMRFNFEWLLRDLRARPDDRVAIFLRNPGGASITLRELDIVFRSARVLQRHTDA